jgi:hypothetical protein
MCDFQEQHICTHFFVVALGWDTYTAETEQTILKRRCVYIHELRKCDTVQKYKKCEKYKYASAGEDGER